MVKNTDNAELYTRINLLKNDILFR